MINTNPYQPSSSTVAHEVTYPAWKSIARVAVFFHGCVYSVLCIMGNFDEATYPSWSAIIWKASAVFLDAMTCYGIFALAFRSLRHQSLYRIWRFFAWLLPFYVFGQAFWELYGQVGLTAEESMMLLLVGFPIVTLLASPAIVFNFLLVSRLKAMRENKPS